jgi:hypothetical protein
MLFFFFSVAKKNDSLMRKFRSSSNNRGKNLSERCKEGTGEGKKWKLNVRILGCFML